MATRLDIINRALAELGEELIPAELTALTLPNAETNHQIAWTMYPGIRDAMLDAYPWSWQLKRRRLERTDMLRHDAEPQPWKFNIPNPDIGTIRAVFQRQDDQYPQTTGWTLRERFLFAMFPELWADVLLNVSEEAFPALFVNALVLELAKRYSIPITEDEAFARLYDGQAEMALKAALRVDAQSRPAEGITDFSYVNARVQGQGYGRLSRSGLATGQQGTTPVQGEP